MRMWYVEFRLHLGEILKWITVIFDAELRVIQYQDLPMGFFSSYLCLNPVRLSLLYIYIYIYSKCKYVSEYQSFDSALLHSRCRTTITVSVARTWRTPI